MLNISFLKENAKISQTDKLLLRLSFADTITQEDITNVLIGYEIDDAHIGFTLLLAYLHKRHSYITFPEEIVPRLEGLIRFFQHKNATLLCAFGELGRQLNAKEIPILLMKGIAMRYFRPNEPRLMWDVDFLVPEENYDEAVKTALDMGFERCDIAYQYHSTDLKKGAAAIDIHRLFTKGNGDYWNVIREMFSNATKTTAFGAEILVPRPEDVLLITMVNSYYNLIIQPPTHVGEFFWFYDCGKMIKDKKDLDWNILIDTASKVGILYQIQALLYLIDWIVPSIIPADILINLRMVEKEIAYKVEMDILEREKLDLFVQREVVDKAKHQTLQEIETWLDIRRKYRWIWMIRRIPLVRSLFLDTFVRSQKDK
jgi:hypothetical protein